MNPPESQHISARYDWIDLLRAIAILMVIAVHASHGLKNTESTLKSLFVLGGFGVQLFFVASAITLCMSMQRNIHSKSNLYYYCIRRFFRIAPLYYFGIFIYFFWSIAKNYIHSGVVAPLPQYTLPNVLANVLFINGFVPEANNNIVPGGWSIGTEVAFYTIFPLLFSLYSRIKDRKNTVALSISIVVLSYAALNATEILLKQSLNSNEFLYFSIVTELQVFVIGITAYFFIDYLKHFPWLLALSTIAFFATGVELFSSVRYFAITSLALSFASLACLVAKATHVPPLLKSIGQRSFSMYITHFVIMNIIDYGFNNAINLLGGYPNIKAMAHFVTAVVVSYIISGYTKRFIEDPFIAMGNRIILRTKHIETKTYYEA